MRRYLFLLVVVLVLNVGCASRGAISGSSPTLAEDAHAKAVKLADSIAAQIGKDTPLHREAVALLDMTYALTQVQASGGSATSSSTNSMWEKTAAQIAVIMAQALENTSRGK